MRRLLPLLLVFTACATTTTDDTAGVNRTLDAWHRAAAEANESAYFAAMSPDFVFLGTDATERWDLPSFRAFAHPYFAKGTAWTFTPRERHVIVSPRGDVAWFDEKLDSATYGECRGTGVVRRIGGEWKIAHYNLTIPIPNDLAKEVVARIRTFSAAPRE
jgi:ketosteroid isomerase-like protein